MMEKLKDRLSSEISKKAGSLVNHDKLLNNLSATCDLLEGEQKAQIKRLFLMDFLFSTLLAVSGDFFKERYGSRYDLCNSQSEGCSVRV